MSHKIILSSRALQELQASVNWYNEQQHDLGAKFVMEVDKLLDLISNNPQIFTVKASGYYEATVKKFPFILVYKIANPHTMRILHVFHTKRDPALKNKR